MFSLSIVGAGATGLFSTDGQAITLFNAGGGVIQGRYGAANTVAFTLTIDATTGNVTLTQLSPCGIRPAGLRARTRRCRLRRVRCKAVLTMTDGDGDIATATVDSAAWSGLRTTRRRRRWQ